MTEKKTENLITQKTSKDIKMSDISLDSAWNCL